jgi:hypothetical protein
MALNLGLTDILEFKSPLTDPVPTWNNSLEGAKFIFGLERKDEEDDKTDLTTLLTIKFVFIFDELCNLDCGE